MASSRGNREGNRGEIGGNRGWFGGNRSFLNIFDIVFVVFEGLESGWKFPFYKFKKGNDVRAGLKTPTRIRLRPFVL